MRERKRVPETVTAEIKPKKQKQNTASCEEQKKVDSDSEEMNSRTKIPPPPGCCPGSAWQREQVAAFSEVRAKVDR